MSRKKISIFRFHEFFQFLSNSSFWALRRKFRQKFAKMKLRNFFSIFPFHQFCQFLSNPNNKERCLSVCPVHISPKPLDWIWWNFAFVIYTHWRCQKRKKKIRCPKRRFLISRNFFQIFSNSSFWSFRSISANLMSSHKKSRKFREKVAKKMLRKDRCQKIANVTGLFFALRYQTWSCKLQLHHFFCQITSV